MRKLFAALNNKNIVGIAPKILTDEYMARKFDYKQVSLYHLTETEMEFRRHLWTFNGRIATIFNKK